MLNRQAGSLQRRLGCRRESGFWTWHEAVCSFAIADDPWRDGQKVTKCKKGQIIGDGLGRPRLGPPYPAAAGGTTRPYASETSLHQLVGGTRASVDLASVPGVVVPKDRGDLIGSIAWVRFGSVSTFAIAADGGPDYREGSLALHQVLLGRARQAPIGPIPAQMRCGQEELAVKQPFQVKPWPKTDTCEHGNHPTEPADIRARIGIPDGVHILLLASVRAPMTDGAVTVPLSADTFEALARKAGFTDAKLAEMDRCLVQRNSGRSMPRKTRRGNARLR